MRYACATVEEWLEIYADASNSLIETSDDEWAEMMKGPRETREFIMKKAQELSASLSWIKDGARAGIVETKELAGNNIEFYERTSTSATFTSMWSLIKGDRHIITIRNGQWRGIDVPVSTNWLQNQNISFQLDASGVHFQSTHAREIISEDKLLEILRLGTGESSIEDMIKKMKVAKIKEDMSDKLKAAIINLSMIYTMRDLLIQQGLSEERVMINEKLQAFAAIDIETRP